MTDYSTCLQTVAAIGSAVAAIASAYVAKVAFAFQRNSILKRASIEQMLWLLQELHYLKSLTDRAVLAVADEDVIGLNRRVSETMDGVRALEVMMSPKARIGLKRIADVLDGLNESNLFAPDDATPNHAVGHRLDGAIGELQSIYYAEVK